MIDLKNIIPKEFDIVFCGGCDNEQLQNELIQSGIKCKGRLSLDDLAKETAAADILINIGNTVHNQLGSKLVEYIATGKPILNITQFDDCPTIQLLHNYDLKLSISAKDLINNDIPSKILDFINHTEGRTVPWDEILCNYKKYTPKYVTHQIMECINEDMKR